MPIVEVSSTGLEELKSLVTERLATLHRLPLSPLKRTVSQRLEELVKELEAAVR